MSSSGSTSVNSSVILITGAAGYLGTLLVQALENTPTSIKPRLILSDVNAPAIQCNAQTIFVQASLTDEREVERLFTTSHGVPDIIYCLHGIMSRGAEDNFDLGMKVNFDSVRNLLEATRKFNGKRSAPIKFAFTSSLAVYGGPLPDIVGPFTIATPQGTYGATKLMSELLINEYTRKGYVDGRILRLPTVIVRPGAPAAAASSFISGNSIRDFAQTLVKHGKGIIREPLNGQESICPIGDSVDSPELSLPLWLTSAATVIKNLVIAKDVDADKFVAFTRVVCLPGFTATVREELQALHLVGGDEAVNLVKFEDDPKSRELVSSWPSRFDNTYALNLGFVVDKGGIEEVVRRYFDALQRQRYE